MSIVGKAPAVLFAVSILACCATPAQSADQVASMQASAERIIELDREAVSAGLQPPEILKYDAQLHALMATAPDIQAKHDTARAHAFVRKFNAIMAAKDDASRRSSTKTVARNNAIANGLGNGRPNPCIDAMGRNTCAANTSSNGLTYHGGLGPVLKGLFGSGGGGGSAPTPGYNCTPIEGQGWSGCAPN